jgi:hypothetical protein
MRLSEFFVFPFCRQRFCRSAASRLFKEKASDFTHPDFLEQLRLETSQIPGFDGEAEFSFEVRTIIKVNTRSRRPRDFVGVCLRFALQAMLRIFINIFLTWVYISKAELVKSSSHF